MKNKLFCNRERLPRATSFLPLAVLGLLGIVASALPAAAGDAPQWMHALTNVPLPDHDEKTDAVLLYSETNVIVQSADKIRTHQRRVYKILRPDGRGYGIAFAVYNSPGQKVTFFHGWCIPAQGKDYEVKDKDAVDVASDVENGELVTDVRFKVLRIPAPDPGNIIGYEYEIEEQPLLLQDSWEFQSRVPVRESHYSLQLPSGWHYKAEWLNHTEVKPTEGQNNQLDWVVSDVKEVRHEEDMPPMEGVAGQMVVSYFPEGGPSPKNGFRNWQEMGTWNSYLEIGRMDASPEMKQAVASITASSHSQVDKMRALAAFVQHDIRYVAIELGIGGWQPHTAQDVFSHRYGDCKDKTTLLRAMLHEIGVESYGVAINTERGSITPDTPAHRAFNHKIIAIKLSDGLTDPSLIATIKDPKLGMLLFFDPTDEVTPFGQVPGHLQANYGLLVVAEGGELVQLPKQPSAMNGIERVGKLALDPSGKLTGNVKETRMGDRAASQRWAQRLVTNDKDRIKPIEGLLASSLSLFRVTQAQVLNLKQLDQPFGFDYSFEAENYAKNAGGLLLVRPRVLGSKTEALLETKEPRKFPIEFPGPVRDTDTFEITIPAGFEVDDLPPPVDVDYGYASYHSKTEVKGNVIGYTRTFEVKELSVPVAKADELKKFYRIIAGDERNTAVLKPSAK